MKKVVLFALLVVLINSISYSQCERYIVTVKIKQTHFTLDLTQHAKDELNAIKIQIPVDKQFYSDVKIGDVLDDRFRTASLILSGSFGNWKVTIDDKKIVQCKKE